MTANAQTIDLSAASSSGVDEVLQPASHSGFAPSAPARIYLFGRPARGWIFKYPMAVSIEREDDGSVIAVDELFDNYSHGRTVDDAVEDLKVVLVEFYELVAGAADEPSRTLFAHLRTYIDRDQG